MKANETSPQRPSSDKRDETRKESETDRESRKRKETSSTTRDRTRSSSSTSSSSSRSSTTTNSNDQQKKPKLFAPDPANVEEKSLSMRRRTSDTSNTSNTTSTSRSTSTSTSASTSRSRPQQEETRRERDWKKEILHDTRRFERRLRQLRNFKVRFGHCSVPSDWEEDDQLGSWSEYVRRLWRRKRLPYEHTRELEKVGFDWNPTKVPPNDHRYYNYLFLYLSIFFYSVVEQK